MSNQFKFIALNIGGGFYERIGSENERQVTRSHETNHIRRGKETAQTYG
jgi:hypothetical protein